MSSDETKNKKTLELSHIPIVLKALGAGVQAALAEHKRLQQSVIVWKDGKVVEVPPDEIPEFEPEKENTSEKV
jgi:hypothetical protein